LEWLGGDCVELQRKSVVYSHGAYTRYPFQANTAGLPPEVAYECVLGFVRAHFQPSSEAPKDFEAYCLQHFGPGFSKHFLLPYNQKLWGIPAREITAAWCQRFVPLPKLEDVLAGAFALPDPELGYNARFFYPKSGIGALPEAMGKQVRELRLNRAPRAFLPERRQLVFDDEVIHYDHLISTIPLDALLRLSSTLPEDLERAGGALRARNLYYLDVALSHPARRDFHWAYVPEPHLPFYRVGCYSNFSEALAPAGCSSLYVELTTTAAPELADVLPAVLTGLQEMGLIDAPAALQFARLRQLAPAYVLYDHAYESCLATILPWLDARGVIATGRYGAWNYSSMEDALLFGRDAAARVLAASRG
ncbi:MAG TPA: FAD-dependent oxidoreductase, partial [Polyangiales bacterium]|nr:FAD-dependent oxidoreductase [Polyangiales bacterium]